MTLPPVAGVHIVEHPFTEILPVYIEKFSTQFIPISMSEREKQLEALVFKYELAFQAMEQAYYEAVSDDNVGWWGSKYVSPQEQAQAMADEAVELAREEANKLGLALPQEIELKFEKILRPTYVERQNNSTVRVEVVAQEAITDTPSLVDSDSLSKHLDS